MDFIYFPILKSRTSELKAYEKLSNHIKQNILPIVELTKSRVSKHNQDGLIEKKIEEIKKIFDNNLFILDLTTDNALKNFQIDKMLLSSNDGYKEWVNFIQKVIKEYQLNIIPCIHYNPSKIEDVKRQIKQLKESIGKLPLALRLNAKDPRNPEYVKKIKDFTKECILVLDGGYSKESLDFKIQAINEYNFKAIICAYSAFPPTLPNGEENIEKYKLPEQKTHCLLHKKFPFIFYGDYACTHPIRYDTFVRGWHPRIDIPLLSENEYDILYYYKQRITEKINTEKAYKECAKSLFNVNEIKNNIDSSIWGFNVFTNAANGYVEGKSPSFWISVRINIYITLTVKKFRRLRWKTFQIESIC